RAHAAPGLGRPRSLRGGWARGGGGAHRPRLRDPRRGGAGPRRLGAPPPRRRPHPGTDGHARGDFHYRRRPAAPAGPRRAHGLRGRGELRTPGWEIAHVNVSSAANSETLTLMARTLVHLLRHGEVHNPDRSEEHTSELQSRFDLVC